MLSQYLPVLVFIIVALILGAVMIGAGSLLSKHSPNSAKNSPMSVVLAPLKAPIFRLMYGFIWWLFYLLFLIWKQHSFSLGPWHYVK